MNVAFPFFLLALLIHLVLYLSSLQPDRVHRAVLGILVLNGGWLLSILGHLPALNAESIPDWLPSILVNAPYYMPFLSFLVYLRGRKQRRA